MFISNKDWQQFGALLTPSGLSGTLAVIAGLIVTIGVITAFTFQNSSIQQQLIAWQQTQPQKALTTADQTLPENDKPTLAGSWPLIIVWSLIGLVTYTIAASIAHSFSEAMRIKKSMNYVNAKPRSILETTAEHMILRIVALVILGILVNLFFKRIIPYGISASHASASDVLSGQGALYALLSFFVVAFSVHLQTIFLRLALGKIRIFSSY